MEHTRASPSPSRPVAQRGLVSWEAVEHVFPARLQPPPRPLPMQTFALPAPSPLPTWTLLQLPAVGAPADTLALLLQPPIELMMLQPTRLQLQLQLRQLRSLMQRTG